MRYAPRAGRTSGTTTSQAETLVNAKRCTVTVGGRGVPPAARGSLTARIHPQVGTRRPSLRPSSADSSPARLAVPLALLAFFVGIVLSIGGTHAYSYDSTIDSAFHQSHRRHCLRRELAMLSERRGVESTRLQRIPLLPQKRELPRSMAKLRLLPMGA